MVPNGWRRVAQEMSDGMKDVGKVAGVRRPRVASQIGGADIERLRRLDDADVVRQAVTLPREDPRLQDAWRIGDALVQSRDDVLVPPGRHTTPKDQQQFGELPFPAGTGWFGPCSNS